jgi:hypothetical protein
MNAVETNQTVKSFNPATVNLSEGDWTGYINATSMIQAASPDLLDDPLQAKRQLALNYLGKRAQAEGAVYSRSESRVLTPQLQQKLSSTNQSMRFQRYPWLERMMSLLNEIENAQQEICMGSKVLSFSRTGK